MENPSNFRRITAAEAQLSYLILLFCIDKVGINQGLNHRPPNSKQTFYTQFQFSKMYSNQLICLSEQSIYSPLFYSLFAIYEVEEEIVMTKNN